MEETTPPARLRIRQSGLVGSSVGRYLIQARLGAGGMGEVYRAEDPKLRRTVAIKRVSVEAQADPNEAARLLREGQRLSSLNHPNIAAVYDVLEDHGEVFLVMEYVEGTTLRHRLFQPISVEQFFELALQSADALTAAHERGILHRDIKPENIMITGSGQAKLLDFGVAQRVASTGEALTATTQALSVGGVAGTASYMAPEVLMGANPDFRADIFALGVVFYEMLGGRHPFLGPTTTATAVQILQQEPAPLDRLHRAVPEPLSRVVSKALHKDPTRRYQTIRELAADLRAVRGGAQPSVPSVRRFPKPQAWNLATAGAALLVIAALAVPTLRSTIRGWFSRSTPAGPTSATAPIRASNLSLAILPLRVQGDDPKFRAFGDGLLESVTARLSQLSETHPFSIVSSRQTQGADVTTAKQALDEFGTNLALAISLERSQDLVRAAYNVIDTKSGRNIAGDTITVPQTDPFALEDRVSDGIVRALQLQLRPDEKANLNLHGTSQPAAYDYYLQASGYLSDRYHPENVASALAMFDQAISLDPNFAQAYAGRGQAYWQKYEDTKDQKWFKSADTDCQKSVSLGSAGASGHICLGLIAAGRGDYAGAASEYQRALELEPNNDEAYTGLAHAYKKTNRLDDAEKTYQRAIELRPNDRRGYDNLGTFYLEQAEYDKAEKMFQKSLELAPDSSFAYSNLGGVYLFMGRDADAIVMFEKSIRIRPSEDAYANLGTAYFRERKFLDAARNYQAALQIRDKEADLWGDLGDAYFFGGKKDEARKAYQRQLDLLLAQWKLNSKDGSIAAALASCYSSLGDRKNALQYLDQSLQLGRGDKDILFNAAAVYNQLGETGVSLEWLRKALTAGYSPSVVRDAPVFDNLRSNPTFQQLLESRGH
jgi:serine/threonine-protein kinase